MKILGSAMVSLTANILWHIPTTSRMMSEAPSPCAAGERRALSVTEYLGELGVTGETDPRAPTPDEVAEQENQNVQIRIK